MSTDLGYRISLNYTGRDTTARRHGKRVVLASVYGACAYEYSHGEFVDARVVWLDRHLDVIERKREYSCSAVYHPAALPKAFMRPEALGAPEAHHCPLGAKLTEALRVKNSLPEVVPQAVLAPTEAAVVGTITKVFTDKGFGFISANNRDLFFHISDCRIAWESVKVNLKVAFEVGMATSAHKAGKCLRVRLA